MGSQSTGSHESDSKHHKEHSQIVESVELSFEEEFAENGSDYDHSSSQHLVYAGIKHGQSEELESGSAEITESRHNQPVRVEFGDQSLLLGFYFVQFQLLFVFAPLNQIKKTA